MAFDFILIFLVLRFLQKSLNTREAHPQWHYRFQVAMGIAMALFIFNMFSSDAAMVLAWVGKLALVALVYLLYKVPLFRTARPIYIAILPYIIISFASLVIKKGFVDFYKQWDNLVEALNVFAFLWGVGVWMVTTRQRQELAKSKKKIIEEEEKNRMMSAMKGELEKQVAERTEELTKQNKALESTLGELKATQNQLVQSEKMASLGELTAGIAHEIQNPLNFVNNFSEVSIELLDEMQQEIAGGQFQSVDDLVKDIKQNLEKIAFHGKRADGIVKGMLQHSRASTGVPELTNINDLCDEYLRLAYHGLRAKDKSFNAKLNIDLDPALTPDESGNGKVKIIPQDIGRVLLNLLTNAFYEVHKKFQEGIGPYEPAVTVSTKKKQDTVVITVADNGNGIPQEVMGKMFQPFFTTKPTGEGTGLGLSLSYDIITKGHGGSITVETNYQGQQYKTVNGVMKAVPPGSGKSDDEGITTGSCFIIELPIKL